MGSDIIKDKQNGFDWRKIIRAILSGIGGNIVILVFLMTFLPIFEIIRFMPWILAFNAAITGFALADKSGDHPAYLKTISAIAGVFNRYGYLRPVCRSFHVAVRGSIPGAAGYWIFYGCWAGRQ